MPKRTDIHKIMLIGSGPIVIGQACEFDYSGTQACKALREEGYKIVLVNSNPATIMTDPEVADRTYIEPITPEAVARIIEKERPDALLPTLGGQTGLNTAVAVAENGTLEKYGVELIGAKLDVIKRAEERELFKKAMNELGLESLRSRHINTLEEAHDVAEELGFPLIVRPSFTLAGTGGGTAYNEEELNHIVAGGLKASLTTEVLLEESIWGWKEYELELMRDRNDNVVIICSIENMDPMGIHTGDSTTVAPAQTLTDVEYQKMRDWGIAVLRKIGVETGGSNVQFAINPKDGRMVVIEMNPRVSRSSALASKATGFPIAKIAAKLAIGYTLDEISNDITRETPACFEPTIDYCVVKIPRFAFEKFPGASDVLGISMKSVGETMAIGMNFKEALQKALRGLEIGLFGLDKKSDGLIDPSRIEDQLKIPDCNRLYYIRAALKDGMSIERVAELTMFDPWYLDNILQIIELEHEIEQASSLGSLDADLLRSAKRNGFSDRQIADIFGGETTELEVRARRKDEGLLPSYRLVDTCAGEFEAYTPYYYSSYGSKLNESNPEAKPKIIVLGSGPNRIGQGIEFDYCCVHTVMALRELGYETIMVNSNPETVSTDYDTSDKLYFEPLTFEDVMNIYENEQPEGVIVQMGGQTPLNLANSLLASGVKVLGTSADSIDQAEDRERCRVLLDKLGLVQPESRTALSAEDALAAAEAIGFPVMIRPSYVLGGRAMMIARDSEEAVPFIQAAMDANPGFPVLIDRYLSNAIEADVDVLCDGNEVYVGGVMQHVEAAGVHSGDSACATPPHTLRPEMVQEISDGCSKIALELKVKGLLNVQIAVKDNRFYIIEVNPRASRTVPYLSKATGIPLAKMAAKVAVGKTLAELGLQGKSPDVPWCAVKEAVFPFNRFPGVDPGLGPEMKSTGEVMGIDTNFETAFWKSQIAAGQTLPDEGMVFLSAKDEDKYWMVELAEKLHAIGFTIACTSGTGTAIAAKGLPYTELHKLADGASPNVLEMMREGKIAMVINTPSGMIARADETKIRSEAISRSIPIITTKSGARATVKSIAHVKEHGWTVTALQDYLGSM